MAYSIFGDVKGTVKMDTESDTPRKEYFFNVDDVEKLIEHVKGKDELLGVKVKHILVEGKICPIMIAVKEKDNDGGSIDLQDDHNIIIYGCPPIRDTTGNKKLKLTGLKNALNEI